MLIIKLFLRGKLEDTIEVMVKTINILKFIIDLMMIFSPFLLLLGNGMTAILIIFYLVYLPSLFISFLKIQNLKTVSK